MAHDLPAMDPVFDARLVWRVLAEDIGRGDVTTDATVDVHARAVARLVTRENAVVAGLPLARMVFSQLDPAVTVEYLAQDGDQVPAGASLARIAGSARALLTGERTALNFVGRLSGIASQTAQCVAAVAGTNARIVDTRKTTPGLRSLEKYAVRIGGAHNHRAGLDDGILIKDNHIIAAGGITAAVARARASASHLLGIEVECDNEAQVHEAIEAGVTVILLDNMTPARMAETVAWIRAHAPGVLIEASGGIGTDPHKLRVVADSGVDLISLGALTHSAPNIDVSLEFEPLDGSRERAMPRRNGATA